MKILVVVESPAKAKTIERFLGREYKVVASYGHVRDLPSKADEIPEEFRSRDWARLGVDIQQDFSPLYIVPAGKKKHVDRLKSELKGADELLIATDEDREGESIGWHLLQLLKPKVPVKRIAFHEITPEAIREALANPREVDESLVRSQEARRIVDRLYGYSLSPLLWKKVQRGLSAGRVQSVAVRLCVTRERERAAFKSSVYWDLQAELAAGDQTFDATSMRVDAKRLATGRDFDTTTGELKSRDALLLDDDAARSLAAAAKKSKPWRVTSVEKKPEKAYPAPPFITSTLQQEANRKLGFSAQRTMSIAQQLYEGVDLGGGERVGLITYMRTDSVTLSERALTDAGRVIEQLYGAEYRPEAPIRYKTKSRNAQEAHEAIRPTLLSRRPEDVRSSLDNDQFKLYDLVWKRTLACQMRHAELLRTQVEIEVTAAGRPVVFGASGKQIVFPGFLRAYVEGSDDPAAELGDRETILPALEKGMELQPRKVEAKRHETQPPARYTEASLVRKLEEEGIGRPSTYASIIGTIQDRGYVFKQRNTLIPTYTAFAVTTLLETHFDDLVDVGFTSRMEEELDEVARGEIDSVRHLSGFYLGSGQRPGLEGRIEQEEAKMDYPSFELHPSTASANGRSGRTEKGPATILVRIGNFGPYVQRKNGGNAVSVSIPGDVAPADFTYEAAEELLDAKERGPAIVGVDPATGLEITLNEGRFGPYVQLGPTPEKGSKEPAPRRSSLPKGVAPDSVTLADALKWLALPRVLGVDEATGEEIKSNVGRFGPYVQKGSEFRSLEAGDDVYSVGLRRAIELLAAPRKSARGRTSSAALAELGKHPESGKPVVIKDGRYGAYITDGTTNVTLPKGTKPEDVKLPEALAMLAAKAAAGPAKSRRGKAPAAKAKSAGKPASKSAPGSKASKPAAKKSTAKKASPTKAAKPVAARGKPKSSPRG